MKYTIKLVHEYVQKDDVYSFSGVFYVVTLYVVAAYVVTAYVVSHYVTSYVVVTYVLNKFRLRRQFSRLRNKFFT